MKIDAEIVLKDNEIQITLNGKRHLGAVIGTMEYKDEYINKKIETWLVPYDDGSFTPLVMSVSGGMGRECRRFCYRLSEMISDKRNILHSIAASWIKRKISFSLMRSIVVWLHDMFRKLYK